MQDSNPGTSKTLTLEGIRLHYREVGAGAPVLLLHGWGSSADSFKHLEKHLAPNFRVLSLDLPGFGASEPPLAAWALTDYVELVKGFMNKLDLVNPAVVGHSFGGRIAICLGAQGLLSKLILVSSAGVRPRRKPQYYIKVYSYKIAKYLLNFAPRKLRAVLLEKLQRRFGSSDYRNASPILRKTLVNVVNEDLSGLLPDIKVPTLLIWGENDSDTPLYQAKIMEQKIPDAGLVVLRNAGHYSFLDKPRDFNLIADHFLRN
ncbi:MAG: alpha/beta hydrolase [Methylobacter sp.]|jgi:pimeloyl-ACP methyl ester carboxylesterase|nr:alpha/beta hydrolase [Methylobacter sp.]